jgi:hypothetical protein
VSTAEPAEPDEATERPRNRISATLSGSRQLMRIVYRDPEHVSERLTLYASERLAEESRRWAATVGEERPDTPKAEIAHELRDHSAQVARIDGAIAGTPFFLALVPGYLSYLWQESRMALRTAALYGRDPGDLRTAAEVLSLRGVHPTVDAAEEALIHARDRPMPDKVKERRSLRTWIRSGYLLGVFGGFLSPSDDDPQSERSRLKMALGLLIGGAIWLTTWVLPVTFMIAMAWACETHTRQLGLRTTTFYDGEAATTAAAIKMADRRRDKGHDKREIVRTLVFALSILIPIGFVAYADHVRQSTGINWLGALGALVAVSIVCATTILASRR